MPNNISFHSENIPFLLKNKKSYKQWLISIISNEQKTIGDISIIFCTDDFLLEINKTYLSHDYYTDVITFNYNEDNIVSGDIFISIDRVKENSSQFSDKFENELKRVMVHGVLHLLGYEDKSPKQEKAMRKREDEALNLF